MSKKYHAKYYPQPQKGAGFLWKHPKKDLVIECAGLEWTVDFRGRDKNRRRHKAHTGLCTCPARKQGVCVHEQMATDLVAEIKADGGADFADSPSVTLDVDIAAFFDNYLAEIEASPVHSPGYVTNSARSFGKFKSFCEARRMTSLAQIDRTVMRAFRTWLTQKVNRSGEPVKTNTVNRCLRELGPALTKAVQDKHLALNPMAYIGRNDRILFPVRDKKPITILTDDELAILLALTVQDKKFARLFRRNSQTVLDLFLLYYHCGLRLSEAINLTYKQVRQRMIWIEKHHKWTPKWGIERSVPMTPEVEAMIERRWAASPGDVYLFTTANGTLFQKTRITGYFRNLFKEYGIVGDTGLGVSVHCLRYTFATTCLSNNVPPTTVKDWLGHTSIEMTMEYYKKIASKTTPAIMRVPFVGSAAAAQLASPAP